MCRTLSRRAHASLLSSLLCLGLIGVAAAQTVPSSELKGLTWRNIGPFRGGRVSAVAGIPTMPDTFYIGLPQGGVWKSTSAGQTWYPIFDEVKEVCSVGSVQVAPSNPNVVYAGTGEISGGGTGNGVYRSGDAGKTWQHIGLDKSDMVPSMLVDPKDENLLLAAATGQNQAAGPERGVFRTTDGGNTWKRTLKIDDETGAQHIAWAYDNPSVVYAASQKRFRGFGGGMQPGPDIYKSTDEGATWKKLSPKGLPRLSGRVCLAVAMRTQSQRVYLIGTFGLYRSDDGGENWRQMAADDARIANGQGAYTSGVYVDPVNPDIVYTLATCVYRSTDGGKTFAGFKGAPGGDDPQQLWINPLDGSHMLLGGDQGATVTLDSGRTWGLWYNQPTAQVYHVSTDNRFPYWVYATQQDSGCVGTSSRGNFGAITSTDWYPMEGNEGGYIVVDPLNPNISFAVGPVSGLVRVTAPSGHWVQIEPNMSPDSEYQGGNGAMAFSPSNPHELMLSTQYLLSSTDDGDHWRKLSPNLTVDPKEKPSKSPSNRRFSMVSSFSASAASNGVIWAATTSGLIWATKDHGHTWEDARIPVTTKGQPASPVSEVEASPLDPNAAYALSNTFSANAFGSKLYRTRDFGKTWELASCRGLGDNRIAVLRPDPKKGGLLFALAGHQVEVSFNDGDDWQPITLNLPNTQLTDLQIKDNDLVLGTYGRGIWILDDYSPLRQGIQAGSPARLYEPAVAYRLRRNTNMDTPFPPEVPHAENPPLGATIYYSLASRFSEFSEPDPRVVTIDILDSTGKVVRHMTSSPQPAYDDPAPLVPNFWIEDREQLPRQSGLNRVNWNIRVDTPPAFTHDVSDVMGAVPAQTPEAIEGPLALPGEYTVRLTIEGKTYTQKLTVKDDPRSRSTMRDLKAEQPFRMAYYDGIVEMWDGYHQVEAVRASLADLLKSKPSDAVGKAVKDLDGKLAKVAGTVTHSRRFYGPPNPDSFVGLNGFLLASLDYFDYGDVTPTVPMLERYGSDWAKLKAVSDQWRSLQKKDLAALNDLLTKNGQHTIAVPGKVLVDPPAPDKRYLPKPGNRVQQMFGIPGNVYRGGDDQDQGDGDGGS